MKASKGFVNKAKSGTRAQTARLRQTVAKAKLDRPPKARPTDDRRN